jgi:signal transduction histidine kinase
MILRGFALFRRSREAILMSIVISGLFILTIWLRETSLDFVKQQTFALKFALIWMVSLMSWFIVEMINNQNLELFQIRESLLRSEQFAALGQIAAGVAHEINNPIGIITAYSEFLLKNSNPQDIHREDYEAIHKEALRCEKIVSQLLNFANPAAREIVKCNLTKLNEEILQFIFHDKKNQSIEVVKDIEPNLPEILCDPVQIKQALLNIYLNAKEAMKDHEEKKISVKLYRSDSDNKSLILTIRDNGCGIKEEELQKVFEPFFTKRKGGAGLGLSITKRIIEGHSGEINIRNISPHGA